MPAQLYAWPDLSTKFITRTMGPIMLDGIATSPDNGETRVKCTTEFGRVLTAATLHVQTVKACLESPLPRLDPPVEQRNLDGRRMVQ
jgi:hypothetical protein